MTPTQLRAALVLYSRYKTDTAAYRKLAEQIGVTTTTLNQRCAEHLRFERKKAEAGR